MKTKHLKQQSTAAFLSNEGLALVRLTERIGDVSEFRTSYNETSKNVRWAGAYFLVSFLLFVISVAVLLLVPSLSSEAALFFLLLSLTSGALLVLAVAVAISNLICLAVSQKILLTRAQLDLYESQEELEGLIHANASLQHIPAVLR